MLTLLGVVSDYVVTVHQSLDWQRILTYASQETGCQYGVVRDYAEQVQESAGQIRDIVSHVLMGAVKDSVLVAKT